MPSAHFPQQNRLLAALAPADRERIYPHLKLVPMPLAEVMYEPGEVLGSVYFPTDLLNSTDIATLFLDNALNVRRFTEHITRIIHLREGDIGRPLSELASTLIYPELSADAKETLRTLTVSEKQIATTDGHWFNVRIMPYRTVANVIHGVVITFVDISAAKELESRLRKS